MITPVSRHAKYHPGSFALPENAAACVACELAGARDGICALLPTLCFAGDGASVRFLYDEALQSEAYRLVCDETGVSVFASGARGAVYGAATLRQLLARGGDIPHIEIDDEPRFAWRGISMDVCRHFFPVQTIQKLIDVLALYKFNTLHLHLSDDQGFRVESEQFPLLNRVGSWRESSAVKRGRGEEQDGKPHGGFYTKAEIRALVAYAAARGIDIIPEIDLPGHTTAIIAAYPELACDGRATKVATSYGLKDFSAHILCAGDEMVYAFIFHLLSELAELFPAPYFHIGGDEARKSEWHKCPKCQKTIRLENLADERALQGYMLDRVRKHLASLGKQAIIWNDGLADTTGTEFICQHWTPPAIEGDKRTAAHLNAGGRAIMSGFRYLYFDYPYAMTPLKKTYEYRILPRGLTDEAKARVLGCECAMWTEWVEDEKKLFFNLLPRLAAAGELFWSDESRTDYADFVKQLPAQYRIWDAMGFPCAKGVEKEKAQSLVRRIRTVRTFYKTDAYIELNEP
jgi:hexosaminidase